MKKLGLVGGLGPVSTLEYYNLINKRYRDIVKPESVAGENPEMIIYSLNLGVAYEMVSTSDWTSLTDYQMGAIEKCIAAGADFCAIAANTAHIVFEEMAANGMLGLLGLFFTFITPASYFLRQFRQHNNALTKNLSLMGLCILTYYFCSGLTEYYLFFADVTYWFYFTLASLMSFVYLQNKASQ